jgi:alkyl hydroperoxide reductase subunit AhpC
VFVIDPKKVIRLMLSYPASTGRNFDEILRVIDCEALVERVALHVLTPRQRSSSATSTASRPRSTGRSATT